LKHDSLLNHLRSYILEIYPHLEKVIYLDDDVIVQKDLTRLFSLDLHGNINGAVETCLKAFHRLYKYLNFSNPVLSSKIDPQGCGWVFGLNIIDLVAWRNANVTRLYHYWDGHNADGNLWKLGTLPASLLAFYGRSEPLDQRWHVLGLGFDDSIDNRLIESAAVVHFNGNMKPWLKIGIGRFKSLWQKIVGRCGILKKSEFIAARCSVWFNSAVSDRLLWLQLRSASPQVTSVKILGSVMVDLVWSTKEDSLTAGKTMKLPSKGLTIDEERVKDFVTKLKKLEMTLSVTYHSFQLNISLNSLTVCFNSDTAQLISPKVWEFDQDHQRWFRVVEVAVHVYEVDQVWQLEWDMSGMTLATTRTDERKQSSNPPHKCASWRKIPESPWGSPIPIGDRDGDVNRFPNGDGDGDGDEAEKRGWGW
ncbi:probable galacturonosyltransferase 11, partial [Tanacetum coccineum]